MKQIFDWLREQMQEEPKRLRKMKNQCISLTDSEVCAIEEKAYGFYRQCVDEAEAKWEAEVCEWEHRNHYVNCLCKCNGIMIEYDLAIGFTHCPYCGKPIKIVEVE